MGYNGECDLCGRRDCSCSQDIDRSIRADESTERDKLRAELQQARAELVDIRAQLRGHPDSVLTGENGLAAATYRQAILFERAMGRVMELERALHDTVDAMQLWGSWEDGVPEAGSDEFGFVGAAYDRGCEQLGLQAWQSHIRRAPTTTAPAPSARPCICGHARGHHADALHACVVHKCDCERYTSQEPTPWVTPEDHKKVIENIRADREETALVQCVLCGKTVKQAREVYAHPTCYECLPPPEPLPVRQPAPSGVCAECGGNGMHDPRHSDELCRACEGTGKSGGEWDE